MGLTLHLTLPDPTHHNRPDEQHRTTAVWTSLVNRAREVLSRLARVGTAHRWLSTAGLGTFVAPTAGSQTLVDFWQ